MTTPALTPPGMEELAFDDELRGDFAVLLDGGRRVLLHKSLIGALAAAFARRGDGPSKKPSGQASTEQPSQPA